MLNILVVIRCGTQNAQNYSGSALPDFVNLYAADVETKTT